MLKVLLHYVVKLWHVSDWQWRWHTDLVCSDRQQSQTSVRRTVLRGKTQFGLGCEFTAAAARHVQVLASLLLLAEDAAKRALDARLLLAAWAADHREPALRLLQLLNAAMQRVLTGMTAALRTCYTVRTVQRPRHGSNLLQHRVDKSTDASTCHQYKYWFTAKCALFSKCLLVCLSVSLFVQFFSAVFDPISIKLGHVICLGLVVSPRI